MSTFKDTEHTETGSDTAPLWAIEHVTPKGWPTTVVHRSKQYTYGKTTIQLERFDVDGKCGGTDVLIDTRNSEDRPERFEVTLTAACEMGVLLGKLMDDVTVSDGLTDWQARHPA